MKAYVFVFTFLAAMSSIASPCPSIILNIANSNYNSRVLKVVKIEAARFGGDYVYLQRKNKTWNYNSRPDLSGSPLWLLEYFSKTPALMRLFGVEIYDINGKKLNTHQLDQVHTIRIPDRTEILAILKLLNTPINFYTAEQIVNKKVYLDNVLTQLALPFGHKGHLFYHDFLFHVFGSLLFTEIIVDRLKEHIITTTRFSEYITERHPEFTDLADYLLDALTSKVDSLNGDLAFYFKERNSGKDESEIYYNVKPSYLFYGNGLVVFNRSESGISSTPIERLRELIKFKYKLNQHDRNKALKALRDFQNAQQKRDVKFKTISSHQFNEQFFQAQLNAILELEKRAKVLLK